MSDSGYSGIPDNEFHLGITMAGAVSAGAYTGGVMDYLFEILDLWQQEKKNRSHEFAGLIPDHNVIIDVMGGASAGGMTTVMAAVYALNGIVKPVIDPIPKNGSHQNIFYDSWVLLDDENPIDVRKTFDKIWDLNDLKNGKVESILNSDFIDSIADRTFSTKGDLQTKVAGLPGYISKDLEVLLSHTMLRGIPLEIDFTTPIGELRGNKDAPSHSTFDHFTISHYKLNSGIKPDINKHLWLNPYASPYVDTLRLTTKATGAFPLGLRFREFNKNQFTDDYLKSVAERIVFRKFTSSANQKAKLNWQNFPKPFDFVSVDGGTINNEPFGEVLAVLKGRYGDSANDEYKKYGLVMIDPFPDKIENNKVYNPPEDIISLIPNLVSTLHDQAKVKRAEMLDAYSSDYFRGVIFPVKWTKSGGKEKYPIACGSVDAFGGFLDINFRQHDFFLGRDNARNFFRYYFSMEYCPDDDPKKDNVHPIHRSWTKKMVDIYKVEREGRVFLPIIPDLNILKEKPMRDHHAHTILARPQYDPTELFSLRIKIETRFEKMMVLIKERFQVKGKISKSPVTDKWMEQFYNNGLWDGFKGWLINKFFGLLFKLTKGGLSRSITESTIKWILKDLEERNLLKP